MKTNTGAYIKGISLAVVFTTITIICWELIGTDFPAKILAWVISSSIAFISVELALKRIRPATLLIISCACFFVVIEIVAVKTRTGKATGSMAEKHGVPVLDKNNLLGSWRSVDKEGTNLDLIFFSGDSVKMVVDHTQEPVFDYELTDDRELFIIGRDNVLEFDWTIKKLSADSMIVSEENQVIRFKRM
jgi:hypothetical protein